MNDEMMQKLAAEMARKIVYQQSANRGGLTEKEVLRMLDIPDFRHLSKAKVLEFASMLDKMDPEVARKALEQFPEFSRTVRDMFAEYTQVIKKGIDSNDESMREVYAQYQTLTESLSKMLEDDNLTFEQKKQILEIMREVADQVAKKDSENKNFILKGLTIAGTVLVVIVGGLAAILGGNTHIESGANNFDNDNDDDIYIDI